MPFLEIEYFSHITFLWLLYLYCSVKFFVLLYDNIQTKVNDRIDCKSFRFCNSTYLVQAISFNYCADMLLDWLISVAFAFL